MLLHFRIQLQNITKPPVWRELIVPDHFSFLQFHKIIQRAFGWGNAHLFFFSPAGYQSAPWIQMPDEYGEDDGVRKLEAGKTKLRDVFHAHQQYTYTYDFGDEWRHKIKLLRVSEGTAKQATLTAGKGACPPEDCGGPWGYAGMKEAINDPNHPEYEELRDWMGLEEGEVWDPAEFELEEFQERVAMLTENS